jgi:hypothetical protein
LGGTGQLEAALDAGEGKIGVVAINRSGQLIDQTDFLVKNLFTENTCSLRIYLSN